MAMNISEMTRPECISLLKSARLGRLACVRDNRPYVVPIHFAFGDNFIFSFSLLGKKVEWMRQNPHVCLQVMMSAASMAGRASSSRACSRTCPRRPLSTARFLPGTSRLPRQTMIANLPGRCCRSTPIGGSPAR